MKGSLKPTWAITRKELNSYLGSPIALIFVGVFLLVTLFTFFWVETFFARNIADIRPLFRWMPLLLIFLVSALTMRQWSEEQRSGTLEVLFTLPIRRSQLVLGKFLAALALVGLSLALTLILPITVNELGNLDWGPVLGGYLASLLMASSYVAIGLFVSSRTDNQIVALIVTVLICGVLYLVGGGSAIGLDPSELTSPDLARWLRAIGTGSHFESIERGVIDLRDLVYYLSLTALFLALNVFSLDVKRWSRGLRTLAYRRNAILSILLIGANLLLLNLWLFPVYGLRADLTAQNEYSLSGVTRDLLHDLQEPLLIRGYFSQRTHPDLAPLTPALRDLMREYEAVSGGNVRIEFVDPRQDQEAEREANEAYGIRPKPLLIPGRYEESVVNAYFDILVRYGDQYVTLGIFDLIEQEPELRLNNPEYQITRAIKKVVYGFQSLGSVFGRIEDPIKLTAFVTPDTLPERLSEVPDLVEKVAAEFEEESGGKFSFEVVDPDDPNSPYTRQSLYESLGLQPFAVSLFSSESYYLHLLLQIGDEAVVLYPSSDMAEADLRTEIEAALKRAAPGFLKTVGLWAPPADPVPNALGGTTQPPYSWQMVQEQLRENYSVESVDLSSGRVPGNVDVLVVLAPKKMSDAERFAIDQYLMRGGAVIVTAGNYMLSPQQLGQGLMLEPVQDGLGEMLAHYGVEVEEALVLDTRNELYPTQTQPGQFQIVHYPMFLDVRQDGMAGDSPIVSSLQALTLHWASPVKVDPAKTQELEVTTLVESTDQSWLYTNTFVEPDLQTYPNLGFPVQGERQARPLAVSLHGSFESYFRDRSSPFEPGGGESDSAAREEPTGEQAEEQPPVIGTIESSPESARLVVVGSAEFLNDLILNVTRELSGNRYLFNLEFLQNTVDWAVQDPDLLQIRSRGSYTRLLKSLDDDEKDFWTWLNVGLALLAVVGIGVVWNLRRRSETPILLVDQTPIPEKGTLERKGERA